LQPQAVQVRIGHCSVAVTASAVLASGQQHKFVGEPMPTKTLFNGTRKFDARPDRIDFRDLPYRARLVSLPYKYPSDTQITDWFPIYRDDKMVLNQGQEGSCTGFGLAGVVNYLRWELANVLAKENQTKRIPPERVSARMLYQNARLYDE
jgi:hypothetical protein